MAATTISGYSDEITLNRPPLYKPLRPNRSHGRVRLASFTLTLASQVSGTSFAVAIIPPGARIISGEIAANGTLANSATLAVGLAGTDGSGLIDSTVGATVSDAIANLKAAAAQGTTKVGFALTPALLFLYETKKELYLTLTTGTGTVAVEVVTGYILYCVD